MGLVLSALALVGATQAPAFSPDDPGPTLPFPPAGSEAPPQPVGPPTPLGPALGTPLWRPISRSEMPAPELIRAISDGSTFDTLTGRQLVVAMQRSAAAGAQVARLDLNWASTESPTRPPADPSAPSDPAYDFTTFDGQVRAAAAEGLTPMAVVWTAPARHEGPHRWPYAPAGTWAPDPAAFAAFAKAAARRYSGSFPDPLQPGATLPRVSLWQAWNEPNLPRYLSPQWVAQDGRWVPWAPAHYREMLNAFYAAVKSVDPSDTVISAGTAPNGPVNDGAGRMTPLRFWQSLLCLGRPPRISLAPCAVPAHMDVLAYHPLSVQNPDQPAGGLGIGVADIDKLRRLLDTAQLTGRVVPSTGTQLWVTELNWDLTTPSRRGATPAELARWIPRALYLLWRGGVSLVTWEFLRDPVDPLIHLGGLWSHNPLAVHDITGDQPKPQLAAFTFPLTVPRVNRKVVEVWSLLPNSRPGPVSLQRLVGGRWRLKARLQAGVGGMVDAYVRLRGSAVVRLVAPGVGISPPAAVSRKATPFPSPPPTVRKSPSHRRTTRSRRR